MLGLVGGGHPLHPVAPDVPVPVQAHRNPVGHRRRPTAAVVHAFGQWSGGQLTAGRALLVVVCALLALAVFGYPAGPRQVLIDLKGHEPGRLMLLLALSHAGARGDGRQAGRHCLGRPLHRRRVHSVPAVPRARAGAARRPADLGRARSVCSRCSARWQRARRSRPSAPRASRSRSILSKNAMPGDVVLYCPDQLGPAIAREIRAGRGGTGLKNYTIPTFTAPTASTGSTTRSATWQPSQHVPQLVSARSATRGQSPDLARLLRRIPDLPDPLP